MPNSNFPNGFNYGLVVRGMPILNSYGGDVYWVDSNVGGNEGTFARPFTSMEVATNSGVLSAGDIVMVKPGHVETVIAAGGLTLDVEGVAYVGLGSGSNRPQVNFTTAVGADMDVDAANITTANFLFTGGVDALTGPIDVNAADFTMVNCETRDVTGQATDFIVTDANADRFSLVGWTHRGAATAGADTALSIVGGADITVIPEFVDGNFEVAAIENVTTAATNLQVFGSGAYPAYLRTRNAADVIFTAVSTSTGRVGPNLNVRLQDDAANVTESFVGADMNFFQPINVTNADGESSLQLNIAASTDAT